jgi:hypothetical protein
VPAAAGAAGASKPKRSESEHGFFESLCCSAGNPAADRIVGGDVRLGALLVVAALTGGAGGGDDPSAGRSNSGAPDSTADEGDTRYQATATVLESPDHGPQLCLGGIADSYPPQCGGPDVEGFDWSDVEGEESANGTTWGTYTVVGAWDGDALTLTEPPRPPEDRPPSPEVRFPTPCPEPDGGWHVVDRAKTSQPAMDAAMSYARSQPTIGGVWLDQSTNPAFHQDPPDELAMNDPTKLVLNLSFTDDLARHEARVREVWGGALCVSKADMSAADLREIRADVEAAVPDFLGSSIDEINSRVEISVAVDDGLQQRFDQEYGPGRVEVQAQLLPVDR